MENYDNDRLHQKQNQYAQRSVVHAQVRHSNEQKNNELFVRITHSYVPIAKFFSQSRQPIFESSNREEREDGPLSFRELMRFASQNCRTLVTPYLCECNDHFTDVHSFRNVVNMMKPGVSMRSTTMSYRKNAIDCIKTSLHASSTTSRLVRPLDCAIEKSDKSISFVILRNDASHGPIRVYFLEHSKSFSASFLDFVSLSTQISL